MSHQPVADSTSDGGTSKSDAARGSATIEAAVLFPAVLLLIFSGVQAAEWYHVRSLCLAAADIGVEAGRRVGAGPAAGEAAARQFLTRSGGGSLTGVAVSSAGSTPGTVRIQVSASVPRVLPLPGISLRVSQSARGPQEQFTVDSRGFTNSEAGSGGN